MDTRLLEPITPDSFYQDLLRPGAKVISTTTITSFDGKEVLPKHSVHTITRLLDQNKFPGGFVIRVDGKEWGFYLDGGQAEAWLIQTKSNPATETKETGVVDRGVSEYETIPYRIYQVLTETDFMTLKELVAAVFQAEGFSYSSRRKIVPVIEDAIASLIREGYIAEIPITSTNVKIMLTPKGKKFFESDVQPEQIEEDNLIDYTDPSVVSNLFDQKQNVSISDKDIIQELQNQEDTFFLVPNDSGTFDIAAVKDPATGKWNISQKYK